MSDTSLKFITGKTGVNTAKRKVFCAYHPRNERTAQQVMRDIIGVCDCYVFYYENGIGPDSAETIENELAEMSLFVFVISSDYLFTPSFARDVVFRFATAHASPVLPIMIENGLEEPFNRQVGNIQFILMNTERYDATTIPYGQRLGSYLSSVLISDNDEQRLRRAFDTSIFLSYRKKDRRFAQKLMKLIHENEDCRGIAIWYDEFLTPGEDFNENIQTELENSAAFILVVTPHIVEKDNYIIITEYPAAVEMGKSVIPIEMLPTEQSALIEAYPGISKPMSAEDGQTVRMAIRDIVEQLGGRSLERAEERDFLRGLSYLKGVFVEKNTEIGVRMILEAAQKGVEEAVFTAAQMYRNGEGVGFCLEKAEQWQKKYIKIREDAYNRSRADEDAESLANAYFALCGIYEQLGMIQAAVDACNGIIDLFDPEGIREKAFAAEFRATAQETAAALLIKQGEYSSAQFAYLRPALEVREQQCEHTGTMLARLKLIETYASIAECCANCQDRISLKENVIRMEKQIPAPDSVKDIGADQYELIKRLLICNNRLGHFYTLIDKWNEGFLCIGNTVLLAEKLIQVSDTYDARRQLILAHRNNGDQHIGKNVENHLLAAQDAYNQAFIEADTLRARDEVTAELNRDIAGIVSRQAYVKGKLGCLEDAEALYTQALEQFRHLHAVFETLPAKKDLYDCMKEAAVLYQQMGDTEACEKLLKESVVLSGEAAANSELAVYKKDQASVFALLAEYYKKQWDMDEALRCRKEQCALLRAVWYGTGRIGDLKAYALALKEAMKVSKLAGEFDQGKVFAQELAGLVESHGMFLG